MKNLYTNSFKLKLQFMLVLTFTLTIVRANDNWQNLSHSQYINAQFNCQNKIENFKWSYNKWNTSKSKPKRISIISKKQIITNINKTMQYESVLFNNFGILINQKDLQNELNRIASTTQNPQKLKKMFKLLNNNPQTIAECISRPILVENKIHSLFNNLKTTKNFSKWINSQTNIDYYLPIENLKNLKLPIIKETNFVNKVFTPQARDRHVAIWTGKRMVIWGGFNNSANEIQAGASYNINTDTWQMISSTNQPSARINPTAVWTGNEMIIWGGLTGTTSLGNGGKYNPTTNSWTSIQTSSAPSNRAFHTAIWTGSEMVIWGGVDAIALKTGGRYHPFNNSWTATNTVNAPVPRANHTAIWTGNEMIIWGGNNGNNTLKSGSKYSPSTDSWTVITNSGAPNIRYRHTAVWTGTDMIIWGGSLIPSSFYNNGGVYNVADNSWTSVAGFSHGRIFHSAIWSGSKMVIWGRHDVNTGAIYDPINKTWSNMNIVDSPAMREGHSTVWTGTAMIVFGGRNATEKLGSYGIYTPIADSWLDLIFKSGFETTNL